MRYFSVAEARKLPGVRLVLTANMPGPWGEAAKAVLSARRVSYLPVAQVVMESNDELHAWTGARNAPVALLDEEPPLTTWLDIPLLAERVGSGPSLLPSDPLDRALVLGLSTEICGSDGFGWSRRLELMGRPSTRNPPGAGSFDIARMIRSYGVRPEAIAQAPARMVSVMNGLTAQLRRQHAAGSDYLVGDRLSLDAGARGGLGSVAHPPPRFNLPRAHRSAAGFLMTPMPTGSASRSSISTA
jgi:glutathione S-transferase